MSAATEIPASFTHKATLPIAIEDEVIGEIKNQLLRKYMGSFGSALSLANGTDLYAVEVDAVKRIHTVTHTKPKEGESPREKKSITFGHTFEESEVMHANRDAVIEKSTIISKTSDELYDNKKTGATLGDEDKYAVHNHTQVDIVSYDDSGVHKTFQLKNTKNTGLLLEERYTLAPDAPDHLVVPKDLYDLHKDKLTKIIKGDPSPEKREMATIALTKLRAGKTTRAETLFPNLAMAKQIISDAECRIYENIGKALLPELAVIGFGGVTWEIKDANRNPQSLTTWERIKRFFSIMWDKITTAFRLRASKEAGIEILNGLLGILRSSFKSLGAFISTAGKALNQVWESVYNYLTGKIESFSDLIGVILKTVVSVSIAGLALAFEQLLQSYGIPSIIGGFLAAALAGIAIVFANRGIDASVKSMLSVLSAVDVAKARRKEIEGYCAKALPAIMDKNEELAAFAKQYYAERKQLLGANFSTLSAGMKSENVEQVLEALQSINSAFGASLPWKSFEEFGALMLDDSQAFRL